MNKALIGWGQVRHTRLRPARHAFAYPSAFLMLPMRSLSSHALDRGLDGAPALAINRPGWLSFHDSDHGDGRSAAQGGALAWMQALLADEGLTDADGEIWLQTFPRVLGHTCKPVSFWYAHRQDGSLAAIVAEVNNTVGERHCYLLPAPLYGRVLESRKVFHVSPFCAVEGRYRFRFMHSRREGVERLVARVDHDDNQGALLETSWSGTLEPATAAALRRVAWRFPLLTLGVVARIHWQALLLWLKKVPFWHKPAPPHDFVTR
ncbi:MAG: DUF1365 domain-containing protein [Limnohabitans sp.]